MSSAPSFGPGGTQQGGNAAPAIVAKVQTLTFWPLINVGILVVILIALTLLDWVNIRMNEFASMFAVAGIFGCVMTSYNVGTKKNLEWNNLWPSMLTTVLAVILLLGLARGLAVWKPDIASEPAQVPPAA